MDHHSSDAGPHRANTANDLESITDMIRGRHLLGPQYCEHCIELWTAIPKINGLSCGVHQWFAMPATGLYLGNERRSRSFLIVGYSNPEPTGLPNALCFAIPMTRERSTTAIRVFACFASQTYRPLSRGLYWKGGELVSDPLEDFCRCYDPLRSCLWSDPSELLTVKTGEEVEAEAERSNLNGLSYKESIEAHVRLLVDSRETLEDEIR